MSVLAFNRQANFDYEILEKWEAGLVLSGAEVKAVRAGQVGLKGAYVTVNQGEVWLINAHISLYKKAGPQPSYDPTRRRKLLLRQSEIKRILGLKQQKGLTIIPLKLYTKRHRVKLEIGLGRGRKKYDKRELIKKRDVQREIEREISL